MKTNMRNAPAPIRIVEISGLEAKERNEFPLYSSRVPAGFPSPADDFLDQKLDLNEYLIAHPSATFFVRVEGDSMIRAGIFSGDLLIVDRSLEVRDGAICVALLNGEFTVKRIGKKGNSLFLLPENPRYSPLEITEETDFEVWGTVIHVIHSL